MSNIIASTKPQIEAQNDLFSRFANQVMYRSGKAYSGRTGVNVHYPHFDSNNQWDYNVEFTRPRSDVRSYIRQCVIDAFKEYAPKHVQERVNVETDIFVSGGDGVWHYRIWMDK